MKKIVVLSFLALMMVACTGKSKRQDSQQEPQAVSTSSEENIITPNEVVENKTEEILQDENIQTGSSSAPIITESGTEAANYKDMPTGQVSTKTYKVQKSETLMLVAFKLYGDYSRWKELKELNKDKIKNGMMVRAGMELKYVVGGDEFVWDQKGNPHLIRHGDTLGLISKTVYGKIKRWKDIWNNNKPMIKDPNKIFAGFTLYYIPDSKTVASVE